MAHLIGLSPLTADECLIFPWICIGKVNDHVQVAVKRKCASVSSDLKALYKSVIIIIIIMWKTSASVRRIYDKRGGGVQLKLCATPSPPIQGQQTVPSLILCLCLAYCREASNAGARFTTCCWSCVGTAKRQWSRLAFITDDDAKNAKNATHFCL